MDDGRSGGTNGAENVYMSHDIVSSLLLLDGSLLHLLGSEVLCRR